MNAPRAILPLAPGINCDNETRHAFEQAGGEVVPAHISQLLDGSIRMTEFDVLLASGGFSFGDTIRSGKIFGEIIQKVLGEDLNTMVERGSPVVGICNGFQVLVEAGLLPDGRITGETKQASLIYNESGQFRCSWGDVRIGASACQFIDLEEVGSTHSLPIAHGEGRFVAPDLDLPDSQIVLQFANPDGSVATDGAHNPNGSPNGITAICDPSGVVLGMMPHPERAYYQRQHQNWRGGAGQNPFGALLFKGIVDHAKHL